MQELPSRLHHSAVIVKDLHASKEFYEDIMELRHMATWCESNDTLRKPDTLSPFHYLALTGTTDVQNNVRNPADAAGIAHNTINHGYCVSLYLDDPDGHKVKITCDTQEATDNASLIRNRASEELSRWLSGDHKTNNDLRSATTS